MELPEVRRCCFVFPLKHGTYLISLFGMASGGVGVAGIILFGIAEDRILSQVMKKDQLNEDIKKVILMTVGISSLMMLVASTLMFIGVTSKSAGAIAAAYWVIFIMCIVIIVSSIAAPVSCFFDESSCLVKKVSSITVTIYMTALTAFLEAWFYFITVAWNHEQELA